MALAASSPRLPRPQGQRLVPGHPRVQSGAGRRRFGTPPPAGRPRSRRREVARRRNGRQDGHTRAASPWCLAAWDHPPARSGRTTRRSAIDRPAPVRPRPVAHRVERAVATGTAFGSVERCGIGRRRGRRPAIVGGSRAPRRRCSPHRKGRRIPRIAWRPRRAGHRRQTGCPAREARSRFVRIGAHVQASGLDGPKSSGHMPRRRHPRRRRRGRRAPARQLALRAMARLRQGAASPWSDQGRGRTRRQRRISIASRIGPPSPSVTSIDSSADRIDR